MSTSTQQAGVRQPRARKARPRPERKVGYRDGVMAIQVGSDLAHYTVEEVGSEWGRAFRVTKFAENGLPVEGAEPYTVHFQSSGEQTCECKGHLKWGHCKHKDALAALIDNGDL